MKLRQTFKWKCGNPLKKLEGRVKAITPLWFYVELDGIVYKATPVFQWNAKDIYSIQWAIRDENKEIKNLEFNKIVSALQIKGLDFAKQFVIDYHRVEQSEVYKRSLSISLIHLAKRGL